MKRKVDLSAVSAPPVKARGGWKQKDEAEAQSRAALSRGAAPEHVAVPAPQVWPASHLARLLLGEWGWGLISGPQLQRTADKAVLDGIQHPAVLALAALGGHGTSPHNIQAHLLRKFSTELHPDRLIQPLCGPSIKFMLSPHELFGEMCKKFPAQARLRLGCDRHRLRSFWAGFTRSVTGREIVQKHPHLRGREADWDRLVPIVFHIDAAPFTKRKSVYTLSWTSVVGMGCETESVFLISTWIGRAVDHNAEDLWRCLRASCGCLAAFRYGVVDYNGEPFESGTWREAAQGQLLAPIPDTDFGFGAVHIGCKMDLEAYAASSLKGKGRLNTCSGQA